MGLWRSWTWKGWSDSHLPGIFFSCWLLSLRCRAKCFSCASVDAGVPSLSSRGWRSRGGIWLYVDRSLFSAKWFLCWFAWFDRSKFENLSHSVFASAFVRMSPRLSSAHFQKVCTTGRPLLLTGCYSSEIGEVCQFYFQWWSSFTLLSWFWIVLLLFYWATGHTILLLFPKNRLYQWAAPPTPSTMWTVRYSIWYDPLPKSQLRFRFSPATP